MDNLFHPALEQIEKVITNQRQKSQTNPSIQQHCIHPNFKEAMEESRPLYLYGTDDSFND